MIRNSRWPPCPYKEKTIQMTSFPEPPGGLGDIMQEAYGAPRHIK